MEAGMGVSALWKLEHRGNRMPNENPNTNFALGSRYAPLLTVQRCGPGGNKYTVDDWFVQTVPQTERAFVVVSQVSGLSIRQTTRSCPVR